MVKKTVIFIDGENLVFRYQEMLESGRRKSEKTIHIQDAFVWHPIISDRQFMDAIRVTFYTSIKGDDSKISDICRRISPEHFLSRPLPNYPPRGAQIVPRIFKKESNSRRSRLVDIQITIDIMNAAMSNSVDGIMLVSGDGDFLPLINEVMRRNKHIYLAALSSGLNEKLRSSVDYFTLLDDYLFVPSQP